MLSIVRLAHGNIGSNGNTSCVWQQSKIHTVLPNLPSQCKFIVITRSQKNSSRMKSTRFRRDRIERALNLLRATGHEAWDIQIDQSNLDAWPAEGDLCELNSNLIILERDENGNILDEDGNNVSNAEDPNAMATDPPSNAEDPNAMATNPPAPLDSDGTNQGPAPLQNSVIPEENFEGVMNVIDTTNAGETALVVDAVQQAVQRVLNPDTLTESQYNFNADRTSVTFNQSDVLPTDGFADMNKTKYAWARAFPTVFIPTYIKLKGVFRWCILHDITGWHDARDKDVKFTTWCEYMVWRSDGRAASHPTFAIVLYNHKLKRQTQAQGRYVLNTSDIDPNVTVEELKNAGDDDAIQKQTENILRRAHIHSGNVQGTPAYWRAAFHEFMATIFFHSYITKEEYTSFHTGSLAEFHDPYLRHLLSNYVAKLDHVDDGLAASILNDEHAFAKAVQDYKHVVTHYLASKMEVWMALFMHPVYGVTGGNVSMEFAKMRGAIHYHSLLQMMNVGIRECMMALNGYATKVSNAMEELNEHIQETYDSDAAIDSSVPVEPHKLFNAQGYSAREKYCDQTPAGKEAWQTFLDAKASANTECAHIVGTALEKEFGLHAMHTGNLPKDWVKPGSFVKEHDYRKTSKDMQSSDDVLKQGELKRFKFERELELYERSANMINHSGTHKCSGYCWKDKKFAQTFDPQLHHDVDESKRYTNSDGVEMVKIMCQECRMGFGDQLKFDPSGENNLTRGKPPARTPDIEIDKNGQPRVVPRRNHPRTTQKVHGAAYYVANSDTQIILVNATSDVTRQTLNDEEYESFSNNLTAAGLSGLEHHNGSYIMAMYATSYHCKGGENSQNWEAASRSVTNEYCNRTGNETRTLRSLMGKHMSEITRGMSLSKDQCLFLLGGGILKRSSRGKPYTCSVSSLEIDQLGAGGSGTDAPSQRGQASFIWPNITKKYKSRCGTLSHLNLYKYCVYHWISGKEIIPRFFGYNNRPTWPLKEEYSKWTLTLFMPWEKSVDELKAENGTFATALEKYLWDEEFPAFTRNEILRVKRNETSVDTSESANVVGDHDYTPTGHRENEQLNEAADAALSQSNLNDETGDFEDMNDAMFNSLDTRPSTDDMYWSDEYNPALATKLDEHKKKYYDKQNTSIGQDEPLQLFDEDKHKPENAKSDAQKILIYHHLYYQYLLHQYQENLRDHEQSNQPPPPPTQCVFCEGKPGTGKTFVVNTCRNMNRKIHRRNTADMASAPTGCAAALIDGSTHCRCASIPTGAKFHKTPKNVETTDIDRLNYLRASMCMIIARFMDEHSMSGRPMWGWLKFRHEEFRRPVDVHDEETNTVHVDDTNLTKDVYSRPWGGIPLIYSFGDSQQLPPVMMKPIYDKSEPKKTGSACDFGRMAISEFLDPHTPEQAASLIVIMDEVLRQDDAIFLRVLSRMREGELEEEDVDFLLGRCLDQMTPDDKATFKGALHLVPIWDQAHKIVFDYLQNNLTAPVAKFNATFTSCRSDGKNCCLKESSLPTRSALCVGAKVMLLTNYVVEQKIMNGSVGTIKKLCYKTKEGPNGDCEGAYAIVEFPYSNIPEDDKLIPHMSRHCIPIPIHTQRCDKKCCSISTLPLRVCIALTIHKSQGMTIGPEQQFEKVVVHLPEQNANTTPGLELVALSRASSPECFAIGNKQSDLSKLKLKKIGSTKSYKERKLFQNKLRGMAQKTQHTAKENIKQLDPSSVGDKTFEGGCAFLLNWYNITTADTTQATVQNQSGQEQQHDDQLLTTATTGTAVLNQSGPHQRHDDLAEERYGLDPQPIDTISLLAKPTLNENDLAAIRSLFNDSDDNKVVSKFMNETMNCRSFRCLNTTEWLDDLSINFMGRAYVESTPDSVGWYSSFFMGQLLNRNGNVETWHNRFENGLFNLDHLFIPINVNNLHWIFLHVRPREKTVHLYDSCGRVERSNQIYLTEIKDYLYKLHTVLYPDQNDIQVQDFDSWKDTRNGRRHFRSWTKDWKFSDASRNSPVQTDHYSCGVFTTLSMYLLSKGHKLHRNLYTQQHIYDNETRLKIAHLIWKKDK